MSLHKNLSLIILIPFLGLTSSSEAKADGISASARVRIGGSVHIDIGSAVEAEAYLGIGHAPPSPVIHVVPPPPAIMHVAVPPPPRLVVAQPVVVPSPVRWGIGGFLGASKEDGKEELGAGVGIIGQFKLSRSFSLEVEYNEIDYDRRFDDKRFDRTDSSVGGSLLWDTSSKRFAPYLLIGGGVGESDIGEGALTVDYGYLEIGVGARLRIGRSFQFLADIRRGNRESESQSEKRQIHKSSKTVEHRSEEDYTRFRLSGMIFF